MEGPGGRRAGRVASAELHTLSLSNRVDRRRAEASVAVASMAAAISAAFTVASRVAVSKAAAPRCLCRGRSIRCEPSECVSRRQLLACPPSIMAHGTPALEVWRQVLRSAQRHRSLPLRLWSLSVRRLRAVRLLSLSALLLRRKSWARKARFPQPASRSGKAGQSSGLGGNSGYPRRIARRCGQQFDRPRAEYLVRSATACGPASARLRSRCRR